MGPLESSFTFCGCLMELMTGCGLDLGLPENSPILAVKVQRQEKICIVFFFKSPDLFCLLLLVLDFIASFAVQVHSLCIPK